MPPDAVSRLDTGCWLRVLGVFAHPGDETFGPGGTLARLAEEGVDVAILTLTHGDASAPGKEGLTADEFRRRRREELRAAADILGVRMLNVLDYPDGYLHRIACRTLARRVATAIRRFQPDTVLTFAPGGITGHPDHRATTRAVLRAWHLAIHKLADSAARPCRLALWSVPAEVANEVEARTGLALVPPGAHVRLVANDVRPYLDRQWAAIRARSSQSREPSPILPARLQAQAGWEYFEVVGAESAVRLSRRRVLRPDPAVSGLADGQG
ncbi:MAG: PIG-L family deacetylase [Chloroflexi bacterium]|nr:PIG-L family deacetylase [Chloroflexota bacterium]